jgi:hypothetical protein
VEGIDSANREFLGRHSIWVGRSSAIIDRRYSFLTEWQVRFDPCFVRFVDARHLTKMAFAFRILGRKQVTPGRLRAQNFAACGDLEPFRDRFASFAASD